MQLEEQHSVAAVVSVIHTEAEHKVTSAVEDNTVAVVCSAVTMVIELRKLVVIHKVGNHEERVQLPVTRPDVVASDKRVVTSELPVAE